MEGGHARRVATESHATCASVGSPFLRQVMRKFYTDLVTFGLREINLMSDNNLLNFNAFFVFSFFLRKKRNDQSKQSAVQTEKNVTCFGEGIGKIGVKLLWTELAVCFQKSQPKVIIGVHRTASKGSECSSRTPRRCFPFEGVRAHASWNPAASSGVPQQRRLCLIDWGKMNAPPFPTCQRRQCLAERELSTETSTVVYRRPGGASLQRESSSSPRLYNKPRHPMWQVWDFSCMCHVVFTCSPLEYVPVSLLARLSLSGGRRRKTPREYPVTFSEALVRLVTVHSRVWFDITVKAVPRFERIFENLQVGDIQVFQVGLGSHVLTLLVGRH